MLNPIELETSIHDELERVSAGIESMGTNSIRLTDIANRISVEGISKPMVEMINLIQPAALESLHPASFTLLPSTTNLKPSLEGIFSSAWNMLKSVAAAVLEFIIRGLEWLLERTGKAQTGEALRKGTETYGRTAEYYYKLIAKTKADLETRRSDHSYADMMKSYDEVVNGTSAEVVEAVDSAKSSYSILVRASLLDIKTTERLLSYHSHVGEVDKAFRAVVNEYLAVINSIREDDGVEKIQAVLDRVVYLHNLFQSTLTPLASNISHLKMAGINMPALDKEDPEIFLANFRTELMRAAMTPSGYKVEEDLPDVHDRVTRITHLSLVTDKVVKSFAKRGPEYTDLLKSVSKLRKIAQSRDFGKNHIVENEPVVHRDLLIANRRLRAMVLTIIRLREIPDVFRKAHGRFVGQNGKAILSQINSLKDL